MFSLNRTLPSVIPFASRVGFGRTPKPLIQLWRTPLTRDFFSSPYVLAMKRSKPAPSAVSEVLIFKNEEIRASKMRVVYKDATTGEGKWEILTKSQALELAKKMDLDLVLVNDKTDPPVCKLEKYSSIVLAAKKKEKLARTNSKSGVMREIDMIVGIEPRDFEMKMNKVKDFLTNGNSVKVELTVKRKKKVKGRFVLKTSDQMTLDLDRITLNILNSVEEHISNVTQSDLYFDSRGRQGKPLGKPTNNNNKHAKKPVKAPVVVVEEENEDEDDEGDEDDDEEDDDDDDIVPGEVVPPGAKPDVRKREFTFIPKAKK